MWAQMRDKCGFFFLMSCAPVLLYGRRHCHTESVQCLNISRFGQNNRLETLRRGLCSMTNSVQFRTPFPTCGAFVSRIICWNVTEKMQDSVSRVPSEPRIVILLHILVPFCIRSRLPSDPRIVYLAIFGVFAKQRCSSCCSLHLLTGAGSILGPFLCTKQSLRFVQSKGIPTIAVFI